MENAEGVPEISRGLSDQRERYPRSTIKTSSNLEAVHPQVVGIGARRLRRFTVAPLTSPAEFQPARLIHAEAA